MTRQRIPKSVVIFVAWIEMILFSGIVYGINSLFPVLRKEKLFHEFCNFTDSEGYNITRTCHKQNIMFGYILITASTAQCLVAIPIGTLYDKFGQRWTKVLSALGFMVACVSFIFFTKTSILVYPFAACLAITIQGLLSCNLSLANLFPKYQNRIVAVLSGSVDSSAVILLFVSLLYSLGVSLVTSILVLGCCGFVVMMFSATCLLGGMDQQLRNVNENFVVLFSDNGDTDDIVQSRSLIETNTSAYNIYRKYSEWEKNSSDKEKNFLSKLQANLDERYPTILTAISSRQYALQLLFFTIIYFRFTYLLAQLSLQMEHLFPYQAPRVNHLLFVSSFFFVFGILIAPIVGILVDYFKDKVVKDFDESQSRTMIYSATLRSFVPPMIICCTTNLLMSIFIMMDKEWAVYATYTLLALSRSFMFSINSSFLLQAFPAKYFGKLLGCAIMFSGVISFVQYVLLFENPIYMRTVNFVLVAVSCFSFVQPLSLCFGMKTKAQVFSD